MRISEAYAKYCDLVLSGHGHHYQAIMEAAANAVMHYIPGGWDAELDAVTSSVMAEAKAYLGRRVSKASANCYLRHFGVFMRWAYEMEYIDKPPRIKMYRIAQEEAMRGTPATEADFTRFIMGAWDFRYICLAHCMYLGGLRLNEAAALAWTKQPISVAIDQEFPAFNILGEAQKSRRDQVVPMVPEFQRWLLQIRPRISRFGRVCELNDDLGTISRQFSRISERLGITATPHDYRRAFGTKWSLKVQAPILQRLMRHASISTTMKFYVSHTSDAVGKVLRDLE